MQLLLPLVSWVFQQLVVRAVLVLAGLYIHNTALAVAYDRKAAGRHMPSRQSHTSSISTPALLHVLLATIERPLRNALPLCRTLVERLIGARLVCSCLALLRSGHGATQLTPTLDASPLLTPLCALSLSLLCHYAGHLWNG
jgi:hypothetical protein